MDSNFQVTISANIADLQRSIKDAQATLAQFKQSADGAAEATRNMEANANRGRLVAFAFGQVLRDAGFFAQDFRLGILAISNNIPILIDQLVLLSGVSKGVGSALSILGSLLTAGLTIWAYSGNAINKNKQSLDDWRESLDDATEAQLKGSQAATKELVELNLLYKAATNAANSNKTRTQAAQELQRLYPSIFGNIDTEKIKLGQVGNAYNELRKSILEVAFAEAAKDKIVQNANRILDNQTKVIEARNKANKLSIDLAAEEAKTRGVNRDIIAAGQGGVGVPGASGVRVNKDLEASFARQDKLKLQIAEQDAIIFNSTTDTNILNERNVVLLNEVDKYTASYVNNLGKANTELEQGVRNAEELAKAQGAPTGGRPLGAGAVRPVDITGDYMRQFTDMQLFISDMIPTVGQMIQGVVSQVANGFADIISTFADGLGQLLSGDMSISQFGQTLVQSISKFLSQIGKQMIAFGAATIAYGVAMKAIKSGNPAAMITGGAGLIAAGAALTAIGAAISGMVGGGESSSSSSASPTPTFGSLTPRPAASPTSTTAMAVNSLAGGGVLETRVSGNDLVILMDRASKNRGEYF